MAASSRPISVSAEQMAPIERVTVVGSGLMGSGIAQVLGTRYNSYLSSRVKLS